MTANAAQNRLAQATSPYLLQHAGNPVDWWEWGPEALAAARASNRPILLSVGYAACHWCHVMAHESFEDADTAAQMNALFINIKVDREERPDLDLIYQAALSAQGEHGGWPLTMFLTPDGTPFFGGTYFPPTARYGRPAFRQILVGVSKFYQDHPTKVTEAGLQLQPALQQLARSRPGDLPTIEHANRATVQMMRAVDGDWGGLGGAPKFPNVPIFHLLWRAWCRLRVSGYADAVALTLDRMAQGGIYDHLGGGFARYATDAEWLVPHFEKMLYDNGLLLDLYALAWSRERSPLYAARMAETVAWLDRDMTAELGAFAAAFDADSEGEEGKYYVWTLEEIDRLLGPDALLIAQHYDVRPGGNWEGHSILHRTPRRELAAPEIEARLAAARSVLLAERAKRIPPLRDDKILADWNGMAVQGLVRAACCLQRPDWLDLAERVMHGIRTGMVTADGRLVHAYRAGRQGTTGLLDDYAALTLAALALFEAGRGTSWLDQALAWAEQAIADFWDERDGGFYQSAAHASDLIVRPKPVQDHATPAANGTMAQALARLWLITGDDRWRDRTDATLRAFGGLIAQAPAAAPTLLGALELLTEARTVTLMVPDGSEPDAALLTTAWQAGDPLLVIRFEAGPAASALVCRGQSCSLPIDQPAALAEILAGG